MAQPGGGSAPAPTADEQAAYETWLSDQEDYANGAPPASLPSYVSYQYPPPASLPTYQATQYPTGYGSPNEQTPPPASSPAMEADPYPYDPSLDYRGAEPVAQDSKSADRVRAMPLTSNPVPIYETMHGGPIIGDAAATHSANRAPIMKGAREQEALHRPPDTTPNGPLETIADWVPFAVDPARGIQGLAAGHLAHLRPMDAYSLRGDNRSPYVPEALKTVNSVLAGSFYGARNNESNKYPEMEDMRRSSQHGAIAELPEWMQRPTYVANEWLRGQEFNPWEGPPWLYGQERYAGPPYPTDVMDELGQGEDEADLGGLFGGVPRSPVATTHRYRRE